MYNAMYMWMHVAIPGMLHSSTPAICSGSYGSGEWHVECFRQGSMCDRRWRVPGAIGWYWHMAMVIITVTCTVD